MTSAPDFRLIQNDDVTEPVLRNDAQVFVQVLSIPPGLPWDQARMASLEARQSAPLPIHEVHYTVRRTTVWSPGAPGRYAAFYVRKEEVDPKLETVQEIAGRPIKVVFLAPAEQRRQSKRLLMIAFATAVVACSVLGLAELIGGARERLSDRLDAAEQLAGVKLHQASALEVLRRQSRDLDDAHLQGRSLTDFLNDLTWASTSKAPDARIEGLHWQGGYMAVEVRGEGAPFDGVGRPVQKSAKPARPGVWLWGVSPAASGGQP